MYLLKSGPTSDKSGGLPDEEYEISTTESEASFYIFSSLLLVTMGEK